MPDDQIETVEETQEAASQPEQTEQQAVAEESTPSKKRKNDVEYNWAEANRKMKDLERQNRSMLEELESFKKQKAQPEEEEETFSKDDILTYAQAEKLAEKKARKIAEEVIRQREVSTVDERLNLKHSDFKDVVTRENIELLKETEPELASSLYHIPDPYQQGVAAYKLLKKLGIGESKTSPEKERAKANSQKPISVNAVTKQSAIGNAHLFENGLTKELKKQLYEEMKQAAKSA